MKDKNRIEPFLNELGQLWKIKPDLRFGQLIHILAKQMGEKTDIYNPEDDEWLSIIKNMKDNLISNCKHKNIRDTHKSFISCDGRIYGEATTNEIYECLDCGTNILKDKKYIKITKINIEHE